MKQHNTATITIPEQFNRLPEPWRSKAIARCEAHYGKKLDEIRTTFFELDGKPFGFLQCAFPWCGTPEGEEVWKAISERGEFPPSDTPAATYRQLINERLPEPFRTQALENTLDRVLEREVRSQKDLEPGFEFVSTLFTWSDSPQGHDYWSRVRRGDLSEPVVEAPAPTPEARLDILESRIAVLEGLVIKPEAPDCDEVAVDTSGGGDGYPSRASTATLTLRVGGKYRTRDGRTAVVERYENDGAWPFKGRVTPLTAGSDGDDGFRSWRPDGSQAFHPARESVTDLVEEIVEEPAPPVDTGDGDGYPSTPPDPGPGYRLVEEGELIEEGDEWFGDDGVWVPTELGGFGARKDIDDPLRRRVAPPAYRLLQPGETILASDEMYLRGEWEEMAGDKGVGETFDPKEDHPIRRRIKSYEDA